MRNIFIFIIILFIFVSQAAPARGQESAPRIGIQIGHLKTQDLPEELKRLRAGAGAAAAGVQELDINIKVAELLAAELRRRGYSVDLLPATVPPSYQADLFISIHADQNSNRKLNGFKASGSAFDKTGISRSLASVLQAEYTKLTKMKKDNHITRNMTHYYAFNFRRFAHAVSPLTPAAIVELGFISNKSDRRFLLSNPALAADGLVAGIIKFLGDS